MQSAISSIMGSSHTSFPPTDTIETSEYYQLESDLPGYKKQDIEVHVTNAHTLVLTGKLQEDKDTSDLHGARRRMRQVHQEFEQIRAQEKQQKQTQQEAEVCQVSLADKVASTESQSRLAEAKEAEMSKCKLAAQTQEKQVQESKAALETSQVHAQKVAQEAEEAKKKVESDQAAAAASSSGPQGRKKSVLGHAKEFIDTQAKRVQLEKKQAQVTDANKAAEEQQRLVDDAMKKAEQAQKEFQAMEAAKSKEVRDIKSQVQGGEAEAQALKEKVQVKQEQASDAGCDKACGDDKASGGQEEHRKTVKAHYVTVERNLVEHFSREFTFDCSIERDQVNATLQNGVLQVLVPKAKTDSTTHQVNID